MKSILYILLLSLIACDYDYKAALKYAKEYCGTYESKPKFLTSSDEPSRFINNCLIAGGQSLDDCPNKLNNGIVKGTSSLIKCLLMHKWNKYENKDEYKETKKKEKSLKINNQWRDKIKQSDFIKENRKKLKKLIKKMVIK